jgi:hypothetical protein
MRRFAAILVVAWFSFSLIGPIVLAASAQSILAACCRRNGLHHCTATRQDSGSDLAWRAKACPDFGSGRVVPAPRQAARLGAAPAIFARVGSDPAVEVQTQALRRNFHDRSGQKRGPPLPLL